MATKLENILGFLIKSITNSDYKLIKEKFPLPTKEPGTGLYSYDYNSPFYQGFIIDTKNTSNKFDSSKNK